MPRADHNVERDREIWAARCSGVSVADLAVRHGIAESRVRQILARVRAKLPPADREIQRTEITARLDMLRAEAASLVAAPLPPVTASGPDGVEYVRDPETREYVREIGGRLAAIKTEVSVIERSAKLLGLDSPALEKSEITYKIIGADPNGI